MDDNWQNVVQLGTHKDACTYHDDAGNPLVNTSRFPSLESMTSYAHNLGLSVGWYFNNCYKCHEKCPSDYNLIRTAKYSRKRPNDWNPQIHLEANKVVADERCYRGDVNALVEYRFDGVKLDACGGQMDLDLWHRLIQESGRPILIEACHWGLTVPSMPNYTLDENENVVDTAWCPFHYWRTSGDVW